jgi:hypothetical protein
MAVLTPTPRMQFFAADGTPLVGGKVYTYQAGTTSPQATYTDTTGVTSNTNPIILNSRGEAAIWLGGLNYKFKLTDANDVEIWTVDYISGPISGASPTLTGNVAIESDSSSPALKITQTGSGYALQVQDAADPDITPFVIDANGSVGIGTASPSSALEIAAPGVFTGAWAYLPTGTTMLFAQANAPTGWTKSTTHNNKALRVVSGAGGGSGGSVAFTSAFASQAVIGTVGGTSLTIAQMPAHAHTYSVPTGALVQSGVGGAGATVAGGNTGSTGSGDPHSHPFSGTAIDLAVQYVDVIIAVKN